MSENLEKEITKVPVINIETQPEEEFFSIPIPIGTISDYGSILLSILFAVAIKGIRDSKSKLERVLHGINILKSEYDKSILPYEYVKRLDQIMAQIAIMGDYDRVVLGVFHNGVVGAKYSKFEKLAIVCSYAVSGIEELPELGKDVNISDIKLDIEALKKDGNNYCKISGKNLTDYDTNCYLYLKNRNIFQIENFLLCRDNLDLGILSLHYCTSAIRKIPDESMQVINDLIKEVESIIDVYAKTNKTYS